MSKDLTHPIFGVILPGLIGLFLYIPYITNRVGFEGRVTSLKQIALSPVELVAKIFPKVSNTLISPLKSCVDNTGVLLSLSKSHNLTLPSYPPVAATLLSMSLSFVTPDL